MKLIDKDILRLHMEHKGFTHARLATYAVCSRAMVSHLTAGRKTSCSTELAQRIAEALSVPLEALFVPNVPSASRKPAHRRKTPATNGSAA
jgi:transcriptional regulator with XRE-family HTH domain